MYKDLAKWYELVRQMIEKFKLAKKGETIKLILVNPARWQQGSGIMEGKEI